MNKKLLSGLCVAVLLSGLVGCGPKEPKQDTTTSTSTNETKGTENNTTTETKDTNKNQETTSEKSKYGNKSEDYYIFHQDEYDTFHLRGMGKGYGATKARMDSGDYDISIKIPTNYWVNATSIRENDVKEAIRWNDTLEKIDSNNKVREDDRMSLEDIENNEHVWKIQAGMRKEKSNTDLEDTLMASLTYSTENYEESDAKNNFLLDSKKTTVSELEYKGYKLKVVPVKTVNGVPTGVHMFLYLDEHTCLWVKYEPEDKIADNIKDLKQEELVKLATKVLDELVTIKKK